MRPDDKDAGLLYDMLQYARGVARSIAGLDFDDYIDDEDLRLAVERRIEIIGEAARGVSPSFRAAHPEIPWRQIIAERNVLIHEYGEIDDSVLWHVATVDIPQLINLLEPIVPSPP